MAGGRTVPLTVRVTPERAEAVDAARGERSRSAWLDDAITAALEAPERPRGLVPDPVQPGAATGPSDRAGASRTAGIQVVADDRMPDGVAALVSGSAIEIIQLEPEAVLGRRGGRRDASCPHPMSRRAKGLCNACGTGGL